MPKDYDPSYNEMLIMKIFLKKGPVESTIVHYFMGSDDYELQMLRRYISDFDGNPESKKEVEETKQKLEDAREARSKSKKAKKVIEEAQKQLEKAQEAHQAAIKSFEYNLSFSQDMVIKMSQNITAHMVKKLKFPMPENLNAEAERDLLYVSSISILTAANNLTSLLRNKEAVGKKLADMLIEPITIEDLVAGWNLKTSFECISCRTLSSPRDTR